MVEQVFALGVVEIDDGDAVFAEPVDAALEGLGFADDDGADPKLANQPRAVPARCERGRHDRVAVAALAAGLAKGVRLTVDGRIALLHAAVAAAAEQIPRRVKKCGADGDAALGESETGFFDGDR